MDTHGWDIVCACSQAKLNDLLAKRLAATPPTLDYSDGSGTDISIIFDPWRITSFGSDNWLTLELPVKSGTLRSASKFAAKAVLPLDGVIMEIGVSLEFIDDAPSSTASLAFSLRSKASSPNDTTSGAIRVLRADLSGTLARIDPAGDSQATLGDVIAAGLFTNRDDLSFALTTLDQSPKGDIAWMTPKDRQFVFVQGATTSTGQQLPGYLAVVTMVRDLDPKTRTREVDPTFCDGADDLCIAFNKDIFLEHVIMPQLAPSFPGAQQSQFVRSGDDIVALGVLQCPTVYNAGTGYSPLLTSLLVWVEADELKASASGAFDITGLADSSVTFTLTQGMTCSFDPSKGLVMAPSGPPISDSTPHIPWWIYVLGAVALPFVGPLMAAIVVAVIDIVIKCVTDAISQKVSGSGSNVAIGAWTTKAVSWPGSSAYTIAAGGLSDALYLRGSLA